MLSHRRTPDDRTACGHRSEPLPRCSEVCELIGLRGFQRCSIAVRVDPCADKIFPSGRSSL